MSVKRPRGGARNRVHGEIEGARRSAFLDVWRLARRIPRGRVMTYGQIATLLESRLTPRVVGWAMHGCPPDVPWHRVVNASGGCSTERLPDLPEGLQRALLEAEGVVFGENGRLSLERHRWQPSGGSGRNPRGRKRKPGSA